MTAADLKAVRGGETKLPPGETKLEYGNEWRHILKQLNSIKISKLEPLIIICPNDFSIFPSTQS